MNAPDHTTTRPRLTASEWAWCALLSILIVTFVVVASLVLGRMISDIGTGPQLRQGQSTWFPGLDRAAA